MNQCEGQISLMDLLAPVATDNEPPRLLSAGQTVYKVVRGDVEECIVGERTWACGVNNRGYDLDKGVTWNTHIDEVVFTEREPAERMAEQYLLEHEHILGKDIRATRIVAYRYMYFDREVINFYAVLDNGDVYFCYGSMYHHIGKKDEIKKFEDIAKGLCKKAGIIDKVCTVHVFRKTFATRLADNGCPLEIIQELLGHSSAAVTSKHYVAKTQARVRREFERCMVA